MKNNHQPKQATVEKPIRFKGPSLFGFSDSTIVVSPSEHNWVTFIKKGENNEAALLSLPNVYATRGKKAKARYMRVITPSADYQKANRYQGFLVAEHLASALHLTGITNVDVTFFKNRLQKGVSVPAYGPGIRNFYCELIEQKKELNHPVSGIEAVSNSSFTLLDGVIEREISVEPSDKLEIIVESTEYKDVPKLDSEPVHIRDAYQELVRHTSARPLARLGNPLLYMAWSLGKKIVCRGVGEENYVLVKPGDTATDITERMQEQYRKGRNEHLYHTALDFFGELYTIGSPDIKGRFRLKNSTHITRIPALKKFYESGAFQKIHPEHQEDKRLTFYIN